MNLTRVYTVVVSTILVLEPFVIGSSFRELGTWLWVGLGVAGFLALGLERRRQTP